MNDDFILVDENDDVILRLSNMSEERAVALSEEEIDGSLNETYTLYKIVKQFIL